MQCKFCGYENSLISQSKDAKCFQCGAEINYNNKNIDKGSIIGKTLKHKLK